MAKQKRERLPLLRVKDTDDLKTIYAKALRAFTAADLQKFTEIEPCIPAEQVVAELEAVDREETEKRKRREETKKRKRKKD
jgi:rRNA-processing protein FCF1